MKSFAGPTAAPFKVLSKQNCAALLATSVTVRRSGRNVLVSGSAPPIAAWAEPTPISGIASTAAQTASRATPTRLNREEMILHPVVVGLAAEHAISQGNRSGPR